VDEDDGEEEDEETLQPWYFRRPAGELKRAARGDWGGHAGSTTLTGGE
jgi:hypothetical protein